MGGTILLVPSVRRGNGSGHLSRCFALAKALGPEAAVYIDATPPDGDRGAAELALSYPREFERCRVISSLQPDARFKLVVLDLRRTSLRELLRWSSLGPVACLDEGGPARAHAAYLVDILPRAEGRPAGAPNLADLGFLALPSRRRDPPDSFRRVLVSFGGEDPAGLGALFLDAALGNGLLRAESVTLVSGALSSNSAAAGRSWPGVAMVGPVQDLKEQLAGFDLVVTQFGLTAYEAAWSGCAVLLLNPGREHEALSARAGFRSLGRGRVSPARLREALSDPSALAAASAAAAPRERADLAAVLLALEPRHAGACPACGRRDGHAVYRTARKTCFRCPDCGLVRMASFEARALPYTDDAYFFESYRAQYGRTYIEDLPNIRRMASARLDRIERLLPAGREGATVLDVGCAYGAFVAEAQSRGWTAIGSDLSSHAVEYVRTAFGAPAFVADFAEAGTSGFYPRDLDCLAMWYVIEHFDDLGFVLGRVSGLLKPGGIFAFSTPSCSGISARRDPVSFWEKSPDDHFTIWSPRSARGILKRHGFTVQKTVVTGHHPERFPFVPRDPKSLRWKLAMALSRLFGLGDTFECYATADPPRSGRTGR